MKKRPYAVPNALAITTAFVYVSCRMLVGLFPSTFFAIAQSWFHGIELSRLSAWNLTMGSFVLGLISSTILAWVVGFIFVKIYQLSLK